MFCIPENNIYVFCSFVCFLFYHCDGGQLHVTVVVHVAMLKVPNLCLCDQRHDSLVKVRTTSPCEHTYSMITIYQISLTWHWSTRGCGDGTSPKSAERWV